MVKDLQGLGFIGLKLANCGTRRQFIYCKALNLQALHPKPTPNPLNSSFFTAAEQKSSNEKIRRLEP